MIGLATLIGLVIPSPVGKVTAAARANPYSPQLAAQASIAVDQNVKAGFQPPFGVGAESAGTEEDWFLEQSTGAILGINDNYDLDQWVPSHMVPPSVLNARLPAASDQGGSGVGRGTGPQDQAYNKGWVVLPRTGWGSGAGPLGHNAQHVVAPAVTQPGIDPLTRAMADAFAAVHKGATRLQDFLGSNS
jgi:hypothetical protein